MYYFTQRGGNILKDLKVVPKAKGLCIYYVINYRGKGSGEDRDLYPMYTLQCKIVCDIS